MEDVPDLSVVGKVAPVFRSGAAALGEFSTTDELLMERNLLSRGGSRGGAIV